MNRDPIETAKEVWNTLNRGLDRAMLVLIIVGMVGMPVLIILDTLGVIAVFDSPPLWNLFIGAGMLGVGCYMALTWLRQKLAQARALDDREDQS